MATAPQNHDQANQNQAKQDQDQDQDQAKPTTEGVEGLHPIGAILGDFVGSRFEGHNIRTTDVFSFAWATPQSRLTDDSVLTLATCDALLTHLEAGQLPTIHQFREAYRACVLKWGNVGFSKSFLNWIGHPDHFRLGTRRSSGCGASIRVSPIGWAAENLPEVLALAERSARSTHDHDEAVCGAQAVAGAVFLLRKGASVAEACAHAEGCGISLSRSIASWRTARWSSETMATVPVAFAALRDGRTPEEVIRLAVSAGGDSDSIASMAGALAEAYWGIPDELSAPARAALGRAPSLVLTLRAFADAFSIQDASRGGVA